MLRCTTDRARPGFVALYTTSGQETERVYSYNPGARTGLDRWWSPYTYERANVCRCHQKMPLGWVPPFNVTQGHRKWHGSSLTVL